MATPSQSETVALSLPADYVHERATAVAVAAAAAAVATLPVPAVIGATPWGDFMRTASTTASPVLPSPAARRWPNVPPPLRRRVVAREAASLFPSTQPPPPPPTPMGARSRKRGVGLADPRAPLFEKFARLEADPTLLTEEAARCITEQFTAAARASPPNLPGRTDTQLCSTFFGELSLLRDRFEMLPTDAKTALAKTLSGAFDVALRMHNEQQCTELEAKLKALRHVTCLLCQEDVAVPEPVSNWLHGSGCVHFSRMHRDCLERTCTAHAPEWADVSHNLAIYTFGDNRLLFVTDDAVDVNARDLTADVELFSPPVLMRYSCSICANVALRACGANTRYPGAGLYRAAELSHRRLNRLAGTKYWTIDNVPLFKAVFFDVAAGKRPWPDRPVDCGLSADAASADAVVDQIVVEDSDSDEDAQRIPANAHHHHHHHHHRAAEAPVGDDSDDDWEP